MNEQHKEFTQKEFAATAIKEDYLAGRISLNEQYDIVPKGVIEHSVKGHPEVILGFPLTEAYKDNPDADINELGDCFDYFAPVYVKFVGGNIIEFNPGVKYNE